MDLGTTLANWTGTDEDHEVVCRAARTWQWSRSMRDAELAAEQAVSEFERDGDRYEHEGLRYLYDRLLASAQGVIAASEDAWER